MLETEKIGLSREEFLETGGNEVLGEDLSAISVREIPFDRLQQGRVVVTGATGLVGSMLVRTLAYLNRVLELGMQIILMVRSMDKTRRIFGELLEREDLTVVCQDITDPVTIEGGVDFILHCASATASKTFVTQPVETLEVAIRGTENLLKLAREKKIKSMVYLSSMEAFGITDPALSRVREEDLGYIDITNVRSSYSEGKRICELLCACYAHEYGVPVKAARLAQTFGAGVDKSEGRVFAQFLKSAMAGEDIVLHTKGESFGNYCYTADAVAGILTILLSGEHSNVYTVVNPATTTRIRDMAEMVASKFSDGRSKVVFDIPADRLTFGYAPDVTTHLCADKLMALGWEPEYDLVNMYKRLKKSWEIV
ncbi:MAG: NAD-dependent epimerase/dehydratase family protein [Lachnospiraceae bacterium]|nr:NAD-dependent epimerase/dehydratase family protein [Lachnospiraceae bacterium]